MNGSSSLNQHFSKFTCREQRAPGERNVDLEKKGMFPVIVSFPRWIEREDLVYCYFFTYLREPTGRRVSRRVSRIITMKFNLNCSLLRKEVYTTLNLIGLNNQCCARNNSTYVLGIMQMKNVKSNREVIMAYVKGNVTISVSSMGNYT